MPEPLSATSAPVTMSPISALDVADDGRSVRVSWGDAEHARFHAFWLADNALDTQARDPGNGQRLATLADVPADIRIRNAGIDASGDIRFEFSGDFRALRFGAGWLAQHRYDRPQERQKGWLPLYLRLWRGDAEVIPHSATFDAVCAEGQEALEWMRALRRDGVTLVTQGPVREGALLDLVARFGHVRETNYGAVFEVRAEVKPTNLAYSAVALPAHTDNPYRDQQPTLQLLYCLANSAAGGESVVVDGFAAVQTLQHEDPQAFDLLASYCARYAYSGAANVHLESRRPIIEVAPDGELLAVRMNNRSIAPITDVPFDEMAGYYAAYRAFEAILARPQMAVTFKLEAGECFVVDNTRVLHSRLAFSGSGERWLQGCYADREGLYSTIVTEGIATEGAREAM
jgi:gamma-butyrobetaine hydroxylase